MFRGWPLVLALAGGPLEAQSRWTQIPGPWKDTTSSVFIKLGVEGPTLFAGSHQGFFTTGDAGGQWHEPGGGISNSLVIGFATGLGHTYAANFRGGVFRTPDGGATWLLSDTSIVKRGFEAVAVAGSTVIAGGNMGVCRSLDQARTWNDCDSAGTRGFYSMAASGQDVFAGSRGEVSLSRDQGATWFRTGSVLPEDGLVRGLAVAGERLFAANGWRLYCSPDRGGNWKAADTSMIQGLIEAVIIHDAALYVGTADGVFQSADWGESWNRTGAGLEGQFVRSLAVLGRELFAGVDESGVWKIPLSSPGYARFEPRTPARPMLAVKENRPEGLILEYRSPEPDPVRFQLFELSGRMIHSALAESRMPGIHSLAIRARIPPGLYVLGLRGRGRWETLRILIRG